TAISDGHAPSGYAVVVQGGRVTSPPGARVLTVVADPGASVVSLSVRPHAAAPTTVPPATAAPPRATAGPARHRLPATGWATPWWALAALPAACALAGISGRRAS